MPPAASMVAFMDKYGRRKMPSRHPSTLKMAVRAGAGLSSKPTHDCQLTETLSRVTSIHGCLTGLLRRISCAGSVATHGGGPSRWNWDAVRTRRARSTHLAREDHSSRLAEGDPLAVGVARAQQPSPLRRTQSASVPHLVYRGSLRISKPRQWPNSHRTVRWGSMASMVLTQPGWARWWKAAACLFFEDVAFGRVDRGKLIESDGAPPATPQPTRARIGPSQCKS